MIIYLAGPMTGYEDYNRHEFFRVASLLHEKGYTVLNPATAPDGLFYETYMRLGFAMINEADAIFLLPGWQDSNGCNRELEYASNKRGLGVMVADKDFATNGKFATVKTKDGK